MKEVAITQRVTLAQCFAAPFSHTLGTPFRTSRVEVRERTGFILRMEHNGLVGFGEIAPLVGFHRESPIDALRSAAEAISSGGCPACPSASFGLSCAMVMCDAELAAEFNLAFTPQARSVGVNALFEGTVDAAEAAWKTGRFTGFRTIKLKFGRRSVSEETALVECFRSHLGPEGRIRLDGNRSMTFEDAYRLLHTIGPSQIEYVEDPLSEPTELPELARKTGLPMAIDETLLERECVDEVRGAEGIVVQVVKPSLVGPLQELESVITQGRIQGCDTVFSNLFETSFTLELLGRVAAIMGTQDRDHGLATSDLFTSEFCRHPIIQGGRMIFDRPLPSPQLVFVPLESLL
ncbi:MAG: o-succinylbenzoate synthase [Planctomycetota bacterium]|nr:o-succinylbenzoate synthase [Planctomycetota bacterium]